MKLSELKKELVEQLSKCSYEESSFEADCIIADLIGCTNSSLRLYSEKEIEPELAETAFAYVKRRLQNEPLQYILGKWEFYGREFFVGDGVLIPRPETELLVDIAVQELSGKSEPVCYDLCSGSGCIGISVSKEIPSSQVYMLEKSEKAYSYLIKNIAHNAAFRCVPKAGDIFSPCMFDLKADLILSNPPYICSDVIPSLQPEVQKEPAMALDGGDDGLMFYREIAEHWSAFLKEDGLIAVEIGEDQGDSVRKIFSRYFNDVKVIKDYSSLDRVVLAREKIQLNLE